MAVRANGCTGAIGVEIGEIALGLDLRRKSAPCWNVLMIDILILTRDHAINKAQYDLTVMVRANLSERRRKRSDASRKGWAGR